MIDGAEVTVTTDAPGLEDITAVMETLASTEIERARARARLAAAGAPAP